MIKLNEVTKIFKSDLLTQPFVALNNVSFEVPEGSMVGFLGANGAGKTTSLKIIMDFIRPTSGEVIFAPTLGSNKFEIFKEIGFLPERPYFYPNLTGNDFLQFMGQLSGLNRAQIVKQITHWGPRFKIDYALPRELKTYSKGMLQRIGFLATIIHNPKIIILDEPLSGLDPIGRKELKDVILEVHKSGKTVFFSSHIVPDVEAICDRVIFLKEGKLVYQGTVSALMDKSAIQDFIVGAQVPESFKPEVSIIKEISLPGQITEFHVHHDQKDKLLKEFIDKKIPVISLEKKKISLEEIFYSSQGKS
jgi:ABC-2 type transport system ATP-binding protein